MLLNANESWHARTVSAIGRADIHKALDDMMARGAPYGANRTHSALTTFYGWLYSRELIPENLMDRIPKPFDGEKPRERVWSDDELKAIWKCADELDGLDGPYLRLLLLMGQRPNEVAGIQIPELDLDAAVWTLPSDRHKVGGKTRRDHRFPLPKLAVRIMKGVPRIDSGAFLFPGRGTRDGMPRHMTVGSKMMKRVRKASGVEDFRFSDARGTLASGLASLTVPPHVVSECLNHAPRGVTRTHYNHYDYLDEQREAFEAWATHIETLVHPRGVTGLRG